MECATITIPQPFSFIIYGKTGSGKTSTLLKLLENESLFETPIKRVVLFYGGNVSQIVYTRLAALFDVEFVNGMNEKILTAIPDNHPPDSSSVIVIDDLAEFAANPLIIKLFAKYRSQYKLNIIFLTQIIIGDSTLRHMKAAVRNATGLVLMKDERSKELIKCLARQMALATNANEFWDVYLRACDAYNYVFLDLTNFSNTMLRIRTGLGIDETQLCYY